MEKIRRLGNIYPMSVSLACILEDEKFNISKFPDVIFVNMRTMYRNYMASYMNHDAILDVIEREGNLDQYFYGFRNDLMVFYNVLQELSKGRVNVIYYYPSYENVNRVLPHCQINTSTTKYIPSFTEIEKYTNGKITNLFNEQQYIEIDTEFPALSKEVGLISHFTVDLLNASRFLKMTLIESWTGKLKTRPHWYTKINFGGGLKYKEVNYPFNRFMLHLFGDKSGTIKGTTVLAERKMVREMAKKDHWTPLTTTDKIKYSLSKVKDLTLREKLIHYL